MNYPADFDTPTFPAGRKIVSSRMMGIFVMLIFLLIGFTVAALFWAQQSVKMHPFLISVDEITGQWNIVGDDNKKIVDLSAAQLMQESALTRFVQYWFWISNSDIVNNARWRKCNLTNDCGLGTEKKGIDIEGDCAIFCLTGNELYSNFSEQVLPKYQAIANEGNIWRVDMQSVQLKPLGNINTNGGNWQVRATVYQNEQTPVEILGYARIAKSKNAYQKTLGYYVDKFDAYKMN